MISENLTVIRMALGFEKKTSFAKKLGLSNTHITNLENGKKEIGSKFIKKLCDTFPQVNRDFLLTGQGEPLTPERPTAAITSSFDRLAAAKDYLLDIFSELSAERQAQIVLLARVLLDKAEENKKNESQQAETDSPEFGDPEIPRRKVG